MIINSADFIKGIKGTDDILSDGVPQIVFAGRSNVGKSSVINSILGRRSLVKASGTPGKTQELNFFLINKKVYFVDLPGYGYAKMSQKNSDKLRRMIIWYLTESEATPRKVILIVDAQVGVTKLDLDMLEILRESNYEVLIVANKIDKLNQRERNKNIKQIKEQTDFPTFGYSAKKGVGKEELLDRIVGNLKA
ncbi:MAG TPA: YihA family ribosome biogenesis GTP-binding protein [Candidatus Yonathbacteria bacterium]|nr:YihA family ribosome biogenesis GTP-binding protein [Candidatus Yonathbacteria bacterium]